MSVLSIYSTSDQIRLQAAGLLEKIAREEGESIKIESFSSFPNFIQSAVKNRRRILLLAEEGAQGVEFAADIREHFPGYRFIWFSDLDFALFSYRLEVDYFGFLPMNKENLQTALRNCKHHTNTYPKAPTERQIQVPQKNKEKSGYSAMIRKIMQMVRSREIF